jgi:beta-lactam-binding protein with PASTA domain
MATSTTVPLGEVISQNPTSGTTNIAIGSSVSFVVSTGPTVPSILGDTQTVASAALMTAGLTTGTVGMAPSATVPLNEVSSQNPIGGTTNVAIGSAVSFVISTGPTVPSILGDTQSAASSALSAAGLTTGTVGMATSTTVPLGEVISQNPTGGTTNIAIGSSVSFVVSTGPTVPSILGDTQTVASAALMTAGLTTGTVGMAPSATVPSGKVISQNPTSGTTNIAIGYPVSFVVSTGPAVPAIVGDTQAAASAAIVSAGLTVGAVTTAASPSVAAGVVISQSLTAGTSEAGGTPVSFVVSGGPVSSLVVSAPSMATPGVSFNFTVTAVDSLNDVATYYSGTVQFMSSDGAAVLPANYSFVGGDAGVHTFSATLNTNGPQTITATDASVTTITGTSGPISVGPSVVFVKTDTTTQGSWMSNYGSQGYVEAYGPQNPPSYDPTFNVQQASTYLWAANTSDPRALQNSGGGLAATWFSGTSFYFDLNLTGGTHQVAIYALDWDDYLGGRDETIQVIDPSDNAVLDTRTISGFYNGEYLVWNIAGHVQIKVTNNASNAVVSAVFFDMAPQVAPMFTSPASTTFAVGSPGTFTVTASGNPKPSITASGSLPMGVTFNQGTGVLSGTPAPGTNTTYPLTLMASNGVGTTASQSFTLTVNAAVAKPQATFVEFDTSTQGSWVGKYGVDGYWVASGPQSDPSYDPTLSMAGQSNYVWSPNTSDSRALQNGLGRIAATWFSTTSFTFDVNLTDVNTHQIALYALDWDDYQGGRSETVEILDANTLAILDMRTVTSFTNGTYLVWNISGHVQIKVINNASNAVISGIFFGMPPQSAPAFTSAATATFTVGTPGTFTVTASGNPAPALSISGGLPMGVTFNQLTGVLSGTPAPGTNSTYNVTFTADNGVTPPASQMFTLTVNPAAMAPQAAFVGFDTMTQGNWVGKYGNNGYSLANGPASLPSFDPTLSIAGESNYTWSPNTSDPRALQNGLGRLAATWFSNTSFTFDVNLTDTSTHQIALYALDWDDYLGGRVEKVQVLDSTGTMVLDTETISSFTNGVYLIWNISGHVQIQVTNMTSGNGVISGVFF